MPKLQIGRVLVAWWHEAKQWRIHHSKCHRSGGFGITYCAQQHSLGREVVIKEYFPIALGARRMPEGDVAGPLDSQKLEMFHKQLQRFREESKYLAQFDHGGIAKVYTVFDEFETAYYVMATVKNAVSLEDLIRKRGPLSPGELQQLIEPLFSALNAVHEKKVIHRDLKPANILFANRELASPVIIDFGAARELSTTQEFTRIYSKGYAPVEQYLSKGKGELVPGPWTDLYAIGACFYYALVGEAPPEATRRKDGETLPLPTATPPELQAMINGLLQCKPKDRPQCVDDALAILQPPLPAGSDLHTVVANAENGATVRLGAGEFVLKKTLVINKKLTLSGAGIDKTSVTGDFHEIANGDVLIKVENHLTISNLLLGHRKQPLINCEGILLDFGEIRVHRCKLTDFVCGIRLTSGDYGLLQHCEFEHCASGVEVHDVKKVECERNKFRDIQLSAIVILGGSQNKVSVRGNTITNSRDCIVVGEQAMPLLEGNILLENRGSGVIYKDNAGGIARGNEVEGNKLNGISVQDKAKPRIEQNIIKRNGHEGILYLNESAGIARENDVEGNKLSGILVNNKANPTLEQNKTRTNVGAGIAYLDESSGIAIKNEAEGNKHSGISVQNKANPTLDQNKINGNERYGLIYFNESSGIARGNEVEGNKSSGILVQDKAKPTLERNKIKQNEKAGLAYFNESSGIARENDIEGNKLNGISVEGKASPTLEQNKIKGNGHDGILYLNESAGIARGNEVEGNKFSGISVQDKANPTLERNKIKQNESNGIAYSNESAGIARGNEVEGNKVSGISVRDKANPSLEHNKTRTNAIYGIAYFNEASGIARENDVERNKIEGILVKDSAKPTLIANLCADNVLTSIRVTDHAQPTLTRNIVRLPGRGVIDSVFGAPRYGIEFVDQSGGQAERNAIHEGGDTSGVLYVGPNARPDLKDNFAKIKRG